ncbi:TonB-dependent receptor domain-containing protein [Niveispirillum fermenti]|uniref:TonB-dependent receptor domain-containing protein n=1 Tax=Niveispirillum fermenti TaxID=1233113 RepID=UPI003A83E54B
MSPHRLKTAACIGAPLAALLTSTTCLAEAADPSLAPEIVVTATATPHTTVTSPATASVITKDELARRPVQDLADAVRGTPGVTLTGVGLSRRGIALRGLSEEHTLTLVDGRRVNVASAAMAHTDFDLNWVPMEAVERIELIRGPLSSLYGSEALGGVINVITRSPTDKWQGIAKLDGGLREDGKGGATHQAGAWLAGPLVQDILGISLSGRLHRRQNTPDANEPRLTALEGRDSLSGSAALTWTPDAAQRIDLTYGRGDEERWRNAQQAGASPYFYESIDDIDREQMSVSHKGNWDWGHTEIQAYRSQLDRVNSRSRGAATQPSRLTDDIVDGHVSVPLLGNHLLTAGGEWRREELRDSTVNAAGEADTDHAALFIQDEITLTEGMSLVLGNRADHHAEYGWQHSPRAYLTYAVTDALTVKGGGGRGFKAPSLKELSPGYSAVGGGGQFAIVGNPDLDPEINTSYEVGAEYRPGGWALRGTLFQNDLKDLIQTLCTAFCGQRGRERRTYQNIDRARIRGAEMGGEVTPIDSLTLSANYTWMATENRVTGLSLAERPRHAGNVAAEWTPIAPLTARVRGQYVGKQVVYSGAIANQLPDYTLWSLDVSWRLTDAVTLRANVENIGDEELAAQSALYSYSEPGRSYNLGLSVSF